MKICFAPLADEHRQDVMEVFNYYTENSFAAYPETRMPDTLFDMFLDSAKKLPAYAILQEEGGSVIGYCLLRSYVPMESFNETAEISYFVKKGHTGQGIGTEALRRLETDAKTSELKTSSPVSSPSTTQA